MMGLPREFNKTLPYSEGLVEIMQEDNGEPQFGLVLPYILPICVMTFNESQIKEAKIEPIDGGYYLTGFEK